MLRGVTRDTIIRVAIDMGIELRRSDISREELYTSDELFLTGTAAGVTSVREVDGRKIGRGEWPLTTRLSKAYTSIVWKGREIFKLANSGGQVDHSPDSASRAQIAARRHMLTRENDPFEWSEMRCEIAGWFRYVNTVDPG